MKYKLTFALLAALSYNVGIGQVTSVPSPSASMAVSGSTTVSESTGKISTSIPLFQYTVGKLSVPVSLNYTGNGVKVVQQSNWVGTNWNLAAGGVVTRIVNDYPDEKAATRQNPLGNVEAPDDPSGTVPVSGNVNDRRADIFTFAFGGYSGSFYLDENLTPRLQANDIELKISFEGGLQANDNNIIKITTPTGERYYFGGVNASERSSSRFGKAITGPINSTWNFQASLPITALATTAFYLYKIENDYGDQILIEYYDEGTKNFPLYERQELPMQDGAETVPASCLAMENYGTIKKSVFYGTIYNLKKIKRIYSADSNYELNFDSAVLWLQSNDQITMLQYKERTLNGISLRNTLTQQNIRNAKMSYLYPNGTTSYRFFLQALEINNSSAASPAACEKYTFDYDSPSSLPDRFSYQVDLLGYYNGTANTSLVAANQDVQFDDAYSLAVRQSNFTYAKKGSLTRIHYPTGGYTEFEYENPQVTVIRAQTKSLHVYRNMPGYVTPTVASSGFSIGNPFAVPGAASYAIPTSQTMSVVVDASVATSGTFNGDQVRVVVTDFTTSTSQTQYIPLSHGTYIYHSTMSFALTANHVYSVSQSIYSVNTGTLATIDATAKCSFTGYDQLPALGLRIKSVKEYTAPAAVANYKRYYYKSAAELLSPEDHSAVVTHATAQRTLYNKNCCTYNNLDYTYVTASLIADPFSNYRDGASDQCEYRFVTTSFGDDNFLLGGIEKEFKVDLTEKTKILVNNVESDAPPGIFGSVDLNNSTQYNGLLLRESVLVGDVTGTYLKSDTNYNYETTVDHTLASYIITADPDSCIESPTGLTGVYRNRSYSNKLVSVVSHVYNSLQNVTAFDPDAPALVSTIGYEYGTLRGLPVRTTTNDSNLNVLSTEYKYAVPADYSGMTGLSAANLTAYGNLNTSNILAFPIETIRKSRKGTVTTVTSRQRSLYYVNNGRSVPEKVQTAKGDADYASVSSFTNYDSKGNLLEITQEGGFQKCLLYGYRNTAVIAEISNAPYADIALDPSFANLITKSEAVVDATTLATFNTALNAFRTSFLTSHPEAQMTTYAYNQDGQLVTTTDSRGNSVTTVYDECKRPLYTKDVDGNVRKEYKYNVKNQ